jgi:hypothetical protein
MKTTMIGIGVAILLVAAFIVAEYFFRPGPYDEVVSRLHPGMTEDEVDEELGPPNRPSESRARPGAGIRLDNDYDNFEKLYHVNVEFNGVDLPLIIEFGREPHGRGRAIIKSWCGFVPDKNQPEPTKVTARKVCHDIQ